MAENKDGQEKSEPASAKRMLEARLRGQVAKSQDVTTAAVLLLGGISVFIFGKAMIEKLEDFMRFIFNNASSTELTFQNITYFYPAMLGLLAKMLMPILSAIFLIVLAAEISQVGLKFATKKFTEGSNLKQMMKPLSGLKKIFFSSRSIFELVKSFLKLGLIGLVVYWVLARRSEETIGLIERPFSDIASFIVDISFELVWKVGVVFIVIAVSDFFYQKHKFREELKMTKQEVKEESKQAEGDPKIKARIRQLMRQRIRKLMLQNVQKADVVITNPTHFAVALSYKSGDMSAPK
ncbi:MAG: Flagellar biosynthetic protein FlhB, partial [Bacteroidota bacterium]|nr:Flagellar biosynthetic protein FlhB [Bacteroidota bacterium]